MTPCQIQLSPECKGFAEVRFQTVETGPGLSCILCGKAFQQKFPLATSSLSIFPIETDHQSMVPA